MELKGSNEDIGVVIGRFQTPFLTQGHDELLRFVASKHQKVLVFVGLSKTKPTTKNTLTKIRERANVGL